ncbi:MAG: choice-of-anchor J domain-containing protein [Flavobacteriales bacterium]|nr:choice-of-anchor J domain-containing protein [Flavobacteriales bacterium]
MDGVLGYFRIDLSAMDHCFTLAAFARSASCFALFATVLCSNAQEQVPYAVGPGSMRSEVDERSTHRREIVELVRSNAMFRGGGTVVTIPVVFHVLHQRGDENISAEQIMDAMNLLNEDFRKLNPDISQVVPAFQGIAADARIEFALATKDPMGNCTNGIDRIHTVQTFLGDNTSKGSQWPRNKYLNIWVARTMVSGAAANALLPSDATGVTAMYDGIMILDGYVGSIGTGTSFQIRALTYTVGRYLGLLRTWEGATMDECGDDGIADTPPTRPAQFCPPFNQTLCNPPTEENYQNFMALQDCPRMFTEGQAAWMQATLASSTAQRDELTTAQNLTAAGISPGAELLCPPQADFYAVVGASLTSPVVPFTPSTCAGTTVRFVDNSAGTAATAWAWTFEDGTPSTSSEQHPMVTFSTPGWKSVSLTVGNANGSTTHTDAMAVRISDTTAAIAPYPEGFEDPDLGPFFGMNHDEDHTFWQRTTTGGHSGSACAWLNSGDRDASDVYDPTNLLDHDDLITPVYDLTLQPVTHLSYWTSYSVNTMATPEVTEKLEVYSSLDCGRTWQLRQSHASTELISNGTTPDPQGWVQWTITLPPSLTNCRTACFRFRFISSDRSGHLYLDDIWLTDAVGIDTAELGMGPVHPNPTNDIFEFTLPGTIGQPVGILITDRIGRAVYQASVIPAADGMMRSSATDMHLSNGLYTLRATAHNGTWTTKILIAR